MIRLVMERSDLTFWPVLSMLIFVISCVAMLIWLYRPGSSTYYGRLSRMALGDSADGSPEDGAIGNGGRNSGPDHKKGGE